LIAVLFPDSDGLYLVKHILEWTRGKNFTFSTVSFSWG
jgi:hypothetical protein